MPSEMEKEIFMLRLEKRFNGCLNIIIIFTTEIKTYLIHGS